MTAYKRVAIDTSKAVFTLHGIPESDGLVLRLNLTRARVGSIGPARWSLWATGCG
jgi:hypothetical protein